MNAATAMAIGKRVTKILKRRFPNLTVEETNDIVADIVIAVEEVLE